MLIRGATFRGLCRARDLLHDIAAPTSVTRLAAQAGVSPFHFIRQFEAVFGTTPHQLRIRARIDRAKDLLLDDRAVTDVCMDIGFSSLGSFSSSFARRVGVSPSDYRRRIVQVPAHLLAPGCLSLLAFLPAHAFRNFGEAAPAALVQDTGL
jgi:AraC-like DNA-binding protein